MKVTIISKDPPGGRCTLYLAYAEAIAAECGAEIDTVFPGPDDPVQPPALVVNDRPIDPADGLILGPEEVYVGLTAQGVADRPALLARLEQVEADFMEGLSS